MAEPHIARTELVLGGQRSGKSRRAEQLARAWLAADPAHEAVLVATARAGDDPEMRERIARHRADRAALGPRMRTVEEPLELAQVLRAHAGPHRLLLVDCLTLWLTNRWLPDHGGEAAAGEATAAIDALVALLAAPPGPVVLVSNEIGLGVVPMGPQVRAFVDALGRLNQQVAAQCERVTWMVAGLPVVVKGAA